MKAIKLFIFILHATGAGAGDVDNLIPFETAHSVEQNRVSGLMLLEELHQFKSLADWHRNQHQLEIVKARLVRAKSEYDRGEELRKEKVVTDKNLAISLTAYEALLIEASRLEYEVLLAKGTAELHKLRVLEEGNPQTDYRKEIAGVLANGLRVEVASLKSRLAVSKTIRDIAQTRYDIGKTLHAKRALSTADLEKRELTYKEAVHTVESVAALVGLSERAAEAFEDNHRRLK